MDATSEIIRQVSALSYAGIFGIGFLANIVVPVPEEVVILSIGYVAGTGHLNFWLALAVTFAGALLSDVIMFSLSLHGNKIVRAVYDKFFAKIVPMRDEFIRAHVKKIIFVSRFLVNLRFIGPFLAGQAKTTYKTFLLWDSIALAIYLSVLMWAGHYFQNRIESIFSGIGAVKNIILVVIGIAVLIVVGQAIKKAFFTFEERSNKK